MPPVNVKESGYFTLMFFGLVIVALPVWMVILAGFFVPVLILFVLFLSIWSWIKKSLTT